MAQFDPSRPALVHDRLNAKTFEWSPEWRVSFERYKREAGLGIVAWDGLLLDGWAPIGSAGDSPSPWRRSGRVQGDKERQSNS
jgi:hypothetical protein